MSQRKITLPRMIYLLNNWGNWQASERVGPVVSSLCGSAERSYASNPRRHVWDGQANVPRETPDDPVLAIRTEEVLLNLGRRYQLVIVCQYVFRLRLEDIAERMGVSRAAAAALLDEAMVAVLTQLEETSWASGL